MTRNYEGVSKSYRTGR